MISGSSILAAVGLAFIALAGLIHVFIFLLESVLWRSRSTWRQFGIASPEDAEVARPWALNQGYYNLFLAIGAIAGGIGGIVSLAAGVSGGYSPLDDPLFSWAGKLNGWGWVAVFHRALHDRGGDRAHRVLARQAAPRRARPGRRAAHRRRARRVRALRRAPGP